MAIFLISYVEHSRIIHDTIPVKLGPYYNKQKNAATFSNNVTASDIYPPPFNKMVSYSLSQPVERANQCFIRTDVTDSQIIQNQCDYRERKGNLHTCLLYTSDAADEL